MAAAIQGHYLDVNWEAHANKISVTLRHKYIAHREVAIFIDKGRRLAKSYGFSLPPDPVVVAVELTVLTPYERYVIRDDLFRRFRYYVKPSTGADKVHLLPQTDHHYDVLFLELGTCPYECDERLVHRLIEELDNFSRSSGPTGGATRRRGNQSVSRRGRARKPEPGELDKKYQDAFDE